jgi:hypothetical protein
MPARSFAAIDFWWGDSQGLPADHFPPRALHRLRGAVEISFEHAETGPLPNDRRSVSTNGTDRNDLSSPGFLHGLGSCGTATIVES